MSLRAADYGQDVVRPLSRAPSNLAIDARPIPSRSNSAASLSLSVRKNDDPDTEEARKAWQEGDFGDIKQALWNMLNKVDELTARIRYLMIEQEELSTSLTVAKSNLTLALSNNEMLEEALSRTPASAQPIGWRRHSTRDSVQREVQSAAADVSYRRSMDTASSTEGSPEEGLTFWQSFRRPASTAPRPATPQAPLTAVGVITARDKTALTSASTPALGDGFGELDKLKEALKKERLQSETLKKEKVGLEQEIESLSQALFEEANKMVADERKRRAQAELDLQEIRDEREAMRRTLRMVEDENRKLRRGEALPTIDLPEKDTVVYPLPTTPAKEQEFEKDKDLTPTQPDRPPSARSESIESDGLDDGVRVDRVWLDAISPPAFNTFPRPLNLVNGFASGPSITQTGATPPEEQASSTTRGPITPGSSLATSRPNHPTLNPSKRPPSPLRQATSSTTGSASGSPAERIGAAFSSAGGYFGQQVSSAPGYISPALHTVGSGVQSGASHAAGWASPVLSNVGSSVGEGLRRLELVSPHGEKGDPFQLVGRGFGTLG